MVLRRIALVAIVLGAATAVQAQSNVYRWVDKEGKVHFSDAPPPEEAKEVTQRRMGGGQVEESQLPYATQVAMKRSPVTFYATANCGELCADARQLLVSRGIPYSERDAATPAEAQNVKKLIGVAEVPVLQVGDTALKGFNEASWNSALDTAGYPRTRLPGQAGPQPPAPVTAPAPPGGTPK